MLAKNEIDALFDALLDGERDSLTREEALGILAYVIALQAQLIRALNVLSAYNQMTRKSLKARFLKGLRRQTR
jgi:hypothetical protein